MNASYITSKLTQTWTCGHCGCEFQYEAIGEIMRGSPAGWHDLDGRPYCSMRCIALAVLADPEARPHIVAQLAAEAQARMAAADRSTDRVSALLIMPLVSCDPNEPDRLYHGYDGFDFYPAVGHGGGDGPPLLPIERREIAFAMIARWNEWATAAEVNSSQAGEAA